MAGEKITIAELDIDTNALVKAATDTRNAIRDIKDEQKVLKITGKETTQQFTKNEVALKKLTTSYNQQKKVLTSLTDENQKFVKTEQAITKAVDTNVKSIEAARANNKELLAVRNKLNLSTEAGQKQLARINEKLNKNNAFIKDNVSAYEQQKIGIGNYEGALRKVFPTGGRMLDTLRDIKEGLVAQKVATKATTTATNASSKALKFLKIALISTGIGAIVVALGSLIAAFQSTQQGADAISKALAPIKGAFQGIIGVIQRISTQVFDLLGARFTIVSGKIMQGIDMIRLGWNKITGDQEEAAEIQLRMVERTKEMTKAQAKVALSVQNIKKEWNGAGDAIKSAVDAQKEIERLTISIEKAENRLIISRSKSNRIIKAQNKIAEDTTKSLPVREAAAKKAIEESQKLLKAEQDIIDMQIKQTELKNSQNDTSRADDKVLSELIAKRNEKETQALEMQTTLTNKLNIIKTQQAVKDKKHADDKVAKQKEDEDKLLEKEEKELQRIQSFEQKKRDLLNQIQLENATTAEEKATIKAEQDLLKEQEALAKMQLTAEERIELEALLLEKGEQIKLDIVKSFQDKRQEMFDKSNQAIIDKEKEVGATRIQYTKVLEGALIGMLGDSLGAKLAAIAIEGAIQAGIVKINAAGASAAVTANTARAISSAIASSPLSGGLPWSATIAASGVKNQAAITTSSSSAISRILSSSALKAVGTLATAKYEKGGLQEIGGKRHSQGGTKFIGEDGTAFEAERGEVIGVMSRQASAKFMEFNNRYTPSDSFSSSMRLDNKFESGGIINPVANQVQSSSNNSEQLAMAVVNKINDIKVIGYIDDITNLQGIKAEIVDGSSI